MTLQPPLAVVVRVPRHTLVNQKYVWTEIATDKASHQAFTTSSGGQLERIGESSI